MHTAPHSDHCRYVGKAVFDIWTLPRMESYGKRRRFLVLLAVISLAGCGAQNMRPEPQVARTVVSTPELQGVESSALADAIDAALKQQLPIHAVVMTRHGTIVMDATFNPFPEGSRHDIASVTKSVTSLLIGIAVQSGKLRDANVTLGEVFHGIDPPRARIRIT